MMACDVSSVAMFHFSILVQQSDLEYTTHVFRVEMGICSFSHRLALKDDCDQSDSRSGREVQDRGKGGSLGRFEKYQTN